MRSQGWTVDWESSTICLEQVNHAAGSRDHNCAAQSNCQARLRETDLLSAVLKKHEQGALAAIEWRPAHRLNLNERVIETILLA